MGLTAILPLFDVGTLAVFLAGWCAISVVIAAAWGWCRRHGWDGPQPCRPHPTVACPHPQPTVRRGERPMTTEYRLAPEVVNLAGPLIKDHHRHLINNGYIRIEYIFRDEASMSKGREVWGKARKVTGLNAFIAREETGSVQFEEPDPFFVIEMAEDIWSTLSGKQRLALVDHELSHCGAALSEKGELVLTITGHDLEEFGEIVRRHGLWKKDVEHFAKIAADQLSLLDAPGGHYDDETGISDEAERYLDGNGGGDEA